MALTDGDRLGHYVISGSLGAGGMGEVYRAEDTRLDRDVAIKVLPEGFADDPERLARFEREAKVLASLNHPNIATLYGVETVDSGTGAIFLVMELIEGEDLAQRIAGGPVPPSEAIAISRQIAVGLGAAHAKGIVHRDLKPANIRITPDGEVKILDFGLAKEWLPEPGDADFTESPTITAEMTRAGTVLGTAPYLSPEQAKGQAIDRRTDIWAFGCVFFEMLRDNAPFPEARRPRSWLIFWSAIRSGQTCRLQWFRVCDACSDGVSKKISDGVSAMPATSPLRSKISISRIQKLPLWKAIRLQGWW